MKKLHLESIEDVFEILFATIAATALVLMMLGNLNYGIGGFIVFWCIMLIIILYLVILRKGGDM